MRGATFAEVLGRLIDIEETLAYDVKRSEVLASHGIDVLRIRNEDLRRDATSACEAIVAAILRRS